MALIVVIAGTLRTFRCLFHAELGAHSRSGGQYNSSGAPCVSAVIVGWSDWSPPAAPCRRIVIASTAATLSRIAGHLKSSAASRPVLAFLQWRGVRWAAALTLTDRSRRALLIPGRRLFPAPTRARGPRQPGPSTLSSGCARHRHRCGLQAVVYTSRRLDGCLSRRVRTEP